MSKSKIPLDTSLNEEWPQVHAKMQRLGLKPEELLEGTAKSESSANAKEKER